jgi:hypothetical protein
MLTANSDHVDWPIPSEADRFLVAPQIAANTIFEDVKRYGLCARL